VGTDVPYTEERGEIEKHIKDSPALAVCTLHSVTSMLYSI
jgi:hypothetical protein